MTGRRLTEAQFAMQCAYIAKNAAAWTGDTLTTFDDLSKDANTDTVARFTNDMRERLDRLDQWAGRTPSPAPNMAPLFWYRPVGEDGGYEGPHHASSELGKMFRDHMPGQWKPLYAHPPAPKEHVICAAVEEYHLVHVAEGEDQRLGRHSAIRGMMVRLGLYPEFCSALDHSPALAATEVSQG
jgi:hypothetical protein